MVEEKGDIKEEYDELHKALEQLEAPDGDPEEYDSENDEELQEIRHQTNLIIERIKSEKAKIPGP